MKRQTLLPIAPCGKILQEAGADRVAYDAAEALEKVLTKLGLEIGELAWKLAKHSGRKTIKKGDVILAAEQKLP